MEVALGRRLIPVSSSSSSFILPGGFVYLAYRRVYFLACVCQYGLKAGLASPQQIKINRPEGIRRRDHASQLFPSYSPNIHLRQPPAALSLLSCTSCLLADVNSIISSAAASSHPSTGHRELLSGLTRIPGPFRRKPPRSHPPRVP